jgi:hypothetical protein
MKAVGKRPHTRPVEQDFLFVKSVLIEEQIRFNQVEYVRFLR